MANELRAQLVEIVRLHDDASEPVEAIRAALAAMDAAEARRAVADASLRAQMTAEFGPHGDAVGEAFRQVVRLVRAQAAFDAARDTAFAGLDGTDPGPDVAMRVQVALDRLLESLVESLAEDPPPLDAPADVSDPERSAQALDDPTDPVVEDDDPPRTPEEMPKLTRLLTTPSVLDRAATASAREPVARNRLVDLLFRADSGPIDPGECLICGSPWLTARDAEIAADRLRGQHVRVVTPGALAEALFEEGRHDCRTRTEHEGPKGNHPDTCGFIHRRAAEATAASVLQFLDGHRGDPSGSGAGESDGNDAGSSASSDLDDAGAPHARSSDSPHDPMQEAPVDNLLRLEIERVANGYVIRDHGAGETWVIANEHELLSARDLLVEVNNRIGRPARDFQETMIWIDILPDRRWMEFHTDECRHLRIELTSDEGVDHWRCPCGVTFAPVPDDAQPPAAEDVDA